MSEIAKLKQRMSNVNKNVTEYRMSVAEAKLLLKEIEDIQKQKEKPPEKVVITEPTVITRVMDGGTF